jgi:hypothetical protein
MSDVHQGSTDSTPAPAPAEAPADVTTRNNAIEGGSEADRIRASVRELNKQREREGTAGEIPEPTPLRYSDDKPKKLRQVVKDTSDYHRLEKPDAQFLIQQKGMAPREVLDLARDKEWTRSVTDRNGMRGDPKFVGPMAQDVMRRFPDKVFAGPDGFLRIKLDDLPVGIAAFDPIRLVTLPLWSAGERYFRIGINKRTRHDCGSKKIEAEAGQHRVA